MRVCSKTQEMLLEFAVWTGILSCVLANILKNQNKKMGKANNVTFVFIRILTSSWQRWKLLLMSRWSVLYMATSSMSAASTTLNNWTPAFFFLPVCVCVCVLPWKYACSHVENLHDGRIWAQVCVPPTAGWLSCCIVMSYGCLSGSCSFNNKDSHSHIQRNKRNHYTRRGGK